MSDLSYELIRDRLTQDLPVSGLGRRIEVLEVREVI